MQRRFEGVHIKTFRQLASRPQAGQVVSFEVETGLSGKKRVEFLQIKGAVDFICDRRELRATIVTLAMWQRQNADAVA